MNETKADKNDEVLQVRKETATQISLIQIKSYRRLWKVTVFSINKISSDEAQITVFVHVCQMHAFMVV